MEKQSLEPDEPLIACPSCGLVHDCPTPPHGWKAQCRRCGATLSRGFRGSLSLTTAFSMAALLLYAPANIFPILRLTMYGASSDNTIWQGCVKFYQEGDWPIALIVFSASILIPLLKIFGLLLLAASVRWHSRKLRKARAWLFRIVDHAGRWSMLDVFVLAILVSLVKLRNMATVVAGKGLLAFMAVVVLTLLASSSFDPRLIWEETEERR